MNAIEIVILVLSCLSFLMILGILLLTFKKNTGDIEEKLDANRAEIVSQIHSSLELLGNLLNKSNEQFSKQQSEKIELLISTLKTNLEQLNSSLGKSATETEQKLENIRVSVRVAQEHSDGEPGKTGRNPADRRRKTAEDS